MERKRQEEKTKQQDKMKDLLFAALPTITLVICFLILYFMWQELGSGMSAMARSLDGIAARLESLL
jgi:hypothetical protein